MGDQISVIRQKIMAFVRARWCGICIYFIRKFSRKSYLQRSSAIFFLIASVIGMLVGSDDYLKSCFSGKYFYAICLVVLFFIIYLIIEIGVVGKLPVALRGLWIKGNPRLKTFMVQILLTGFAGWYVLSTFRLGGFWSYLILSLLSAYFVAAIFEAVRFLREKDDEFNPT